MRGLSLVLVLTGCQWTLGGDGSECSEDGHCESGQTCTVGRCITRESTTERRMDADVTPDMPMMDMDVPDEGEVLDRTVFDDRDATLVDASMPGEISPVFPDGRCFDGVGTIPLESGQTHVPRGLCTPYGRLWTAEGSAGIELRIDRNDGEPPQTVPVGAQTRLSSDGRFVAFRAPDLSGRITPHLLDLAQRELTPIELLDAPVSEVLRGNGLTAYVQDGKLSLHPDAANFSVYLDCSQPDTVQWGVGLSRTRAAWFERNVRGGPIRLVLADTETCQNRIIRPVEGTVPVDGRVHSVGARWLWVAFTFEGTPQVQGIAPDTRGRLRPLRLDLPFTPLEIAGEGDWLVGISYTGGAYRISTIQLGMNLQEDRSAGRTNHRQPIISNGYLTWAALGPTGWEVQYAPLD
jgi:hypothetical protein